MMKQVRGSEQTVNLVQSKPEKKLATEQRLARRIASVLILLAAGGIGSIILSTHSILNIKETINPTERIKLNSRIDDLRIGKSCEWVRGRWRCRECSSPGKCKKLKMRGDCRPFRRQEWDEPPRFSSHFDPASKIEISLRDVTKFGVGKVSKVHFEQPMCSVSTCFDLSRCNDTVLTIYTNSTGPHDLLDYAIQHSNAKIVRIDRHHDACLVLVTKGIYQFAHELYSSLHWSDGGRNNLVWDSSCFFDGSLCDAPFSTFSYGHAALASGTLSRAHLRTGYDLVLPLPRVWARPVPPQHVNIHRPRKWLLSFRGSIQDSLHPYYQHRWLAAEYWENANDVVVDVQCKHRKLLGGKATYKPYRMDASSYDDMIWNSTFGFSPGGSSVGSYRFGEVLSTAGIPVVTQDFAPPLSPEVDWSKCIVIVSEARIVDLPRILRNIPQEEIRMRQQACWQLLQHVIGDHQKQGDNGWRHDDRITFAKAMDVWAIRISNAIKQGEQLEVLNKDILMKYNVTKT
jgi:hypothetical protein